MSQLFQFFHLIGQIFHSATLANMMLPRLPTDEQHALITQAKNLLAKCATLQTGIENLNEHSKILLKALFDESFATETSNEIRKN